MLSHLSIRNYTLIKELDIDFSAGLTIITGETGSGKSILLGALALVLGQRVDNSAIFDKTKKCIVEASFQAQELGLQSFFQKNELDYWDELVLRREINTKGTSRAFINDTPVNLQKLKEIGSRLIDVHSQHQTLLLNHADFQLNIVDSFLDPKKISSYQTLYSEHYEAKKQLENVKFRLDELSKEADYNRFLWEELDAADLQLNKIKEWESELQTLNHAGKIQEDLSVCMSALQNEQMGAVQNIQFVYSSLLKLKEYSPALQKISQRLDGLLLELEDLVQEMERFAEKVEINPEKANLLEEKLNQIYQLQQKHRVQTVEALVEIKGNLQKEVFHLDELQQQADELELKEKQLHDALLMAAKNISTERKKQIPQIEKNLKETLKQLALADAKVKVDVKILAEPQKKGLDDVLFLFSANEGSPLSPISQAASGGELSRIMLAVKSMIHEKSMLPTVIFDEIDSGVSGNIAGKTADVLKKMSKSLQLIVITHLPQIAAKGDHHFYVFKEKDEKSTTSKMLKLSEKEKLNEIAKMISYEEPTEASLSAAKALMEEK